MSSRIEKGGAKFKPSIVPRRSGAASTQSTPVSANVTQASPKPGASAVPSPSPALKAQSSARLARPTTSAVASTSVTPARSAQSYAFNSSPSVISSTSADTPSTSGFRRPAVVKPRPGSRASLTPAPQYQQPQTRAVHASPSIQATQQHISTTPSSKSGAPSSEASISAGASADDPRSARRTKLAPQINAIRPQHHESSTSAGSSTTRSVVDAALAHAIKQSASQVEASRSSNTGSLDPTLESDAMAMSPVALSQRALGKVRAEAAEDSDADDVDLVDDKSSSSRRTRLDTSARRAKRRLKRKESATGKPKRPPSAYILFVNSVRSDRQARNPGLSLTELTTSIAGEWRQLTLTQKKEWEEQASMCRQQYDHDMEEWTRAYPDGLTVGSDDNSDLETTSELDENGQHVRRRKKRRTSSRKVRTVSDDEAEYQMQLHLQGPNLASSRIDPSAMTMGEISTIQFRQGRAGPRTFETDRVYKRMVDDRRSAAKEALLGNHVLSTKPDTTAATPVLTVRSNTTRGPDGEIIAHKSDDEQTLEASEVEESAPETEAGSESGQTGRQLRRRKREASVAASAAGTDVSFRENRFAVQTRIVDGKIVLDETSLFANFDNGEEDRDNMEVVDEREGDRFVNSSTYSRKLGRNRKWSVDETAHFFRAMQQWGTDFEMIARLFPGRDRVMIKKKYNAEERANPKMIDQALRNTLPVSLEAYATAIGVDLSGPPPEIKADLHDLESLNTVDGSQKIKKRENTAPLTTTADTANAQTDEDDAYDYEDVVDVDENGKESVTHRRVGKKATASTSAKPRGKTARKNSSAASVPGSTSTEAATTSGKEARSQSKKGSTTASVDAPSAVGARKSTRGKKQHSAAQHSSEAPGDNMEVEEIIGEL